jgi:hypothetical protein
MRDFGPVWGSAQLGFWHVFKALASEFPTRNNREFPGGEQGNKIKEQGSITLSARVYFAHACCARPRTRSVVTGNFASEEDKMLDRPLSRTRYTAHRVRFNSGQFNREIKECSK